MECDVPEATMIKRFTERLTELDAISRKLKSKTGIILERAQFKSFNSIELVEEFLGDSMKTYGIPVTGADDCIVVG